MALELKDTSEKIISIIARKLVIDPSTIAEQATLQDLGADSLDMVEIVMNIEEAFSVEINDEEIEKLQNLHDLISYVHLLRIKA